jgi:D-alanyl-D-alanine carboxypeptidase
MEIPNPHPQSEHPVHHKYAGAAALVLLGVAAAFFTYSALSKQSVEVDSQTAASAITGKQLTGVSLEAKSAYVVDLMNGDVLYSRNQDAQLPLASLTKVPLVLVVADVLPPDTVITIPRDTSPPGSTMRLAKGERWKVSDVVNFTLIASSNEGANILAEAADGPLRSRYQELPQGSAALFRMNELAHSLGLSHTFFLNVNGLDESLTQAGSYGSAKDIATLMSYAASTSLQSFVGTARDGILLTDETGDTTSAVNTNEALGSIPGLIMGKTGYTDLAGGNLAVVFDVGLAHPVVAVVLGSSYQGRFTDMKTLVTATRAALSQ